MVAAKIREIFRVNLSKILDRDDVNQRELAETIGVSPEVITRWRHGDSFPKTDAQIDKLVEALKIRHEELFIDPKRIRLLPNGKLEPAIVDALRQVFKEAGYRIEKEED